MLCTRQYTHLLAPAQREPVQPLVVPQVAKHRLDRADALAIALPSLGATDALFHRLKQLVRTGLPLGKDRDLPHRRVLRVAQAQWYAQGKVKPVIDRTMPMSELKAAYAHIGSSGVMGKLVMVN